MAGEPYMSMVGNLTADPELRFTPNGQAVANFSVAITPRKKSNQGGWEDESPMFIRGTVWGEYAENVAESLTKGQRVIVIGWFKPSRFTTKEGEEREVMEVRVDEIGPSLRWQKANVQRASSPNGNGGGNSGGWSNSNQGGNRGGNQNQGGNGGWGNQGGGSQQDDNGWGASSNDEPPF